MGATRYPLLYQINTRVYLSELSGRLGRAATLDDMGEGELSRVARLGFDWVWLLGVWQTGAAGRSVALAETDLRREYHQALPDFSDEDVAGSCFAVKEYAAHADFGGDDALERLGRRVHASGMRLMLDFVPNHTALDHRWVEEHPEYYIAATEEQAAREPRNYGRVETSRGPAVLAYGRDPNFAGWSDTLQLNYGNPEVHEAMAGELERIAGRCDGVRCDMAMLILPEVFERTWGKRIEPFWPGAIARARRISPDFLFLAEAYWDLEWTLQQQGFDYAYDKRLYDRLRAREARPVREHLRAGLDYQDRLARFLENHDEPRAAAAFPWDVYQAAAVVGFLTPGLRFLHHGQLEGPRVQIPVQLRRGPEEPVNETVRGFYQRLLTCIQRPVVRNGQWRLAEPAPAWCGNWTWDCFIAFEWDGDGERLMAAVNYAGHRSQCYVRLSLPDGAGTWRLHDVMSGTTYARDGAELAARGLYLDLPPWGYHVFEMTPLC